MGSPTALQRRSTCGEPAARTPKRQKLKSSVFVGGSAAPPDRGAAADRLQRFPVTAAIREPLQQDIPDAGLTSAVELSPDRFSVAERLWQVAPARQIQSIPSVTRRWLAKGDHRAGTGCSGKVRRPPILRPSSDRGSQPTSIEGAWPRITSLRVGGGAFEKMDPVRTPVGPRRFFWRLPGKFCFFCYPALPVTLGRWLQEDQIWVCPRGLVLHSFRSPKTRSDTLSGYSHPFLRPNHTMFRGSVAY
jgi:hypothetical protein